MTNRPSVSFIIISRLFKFVKIKKSIYIQKNILTNPYISYILCLSYIYSYKKRVIEILEIIISNANNQPIYEQIYDQIKAQLISGKIKEGELLPSIRSLAKELRISVITTKRAYDELEKDGYINTVAGKGCFAAKQNSEIIKEKCLCDIETHMRKIKEAASYINIGIDELSEMLTLIMEEDS